ncbi:MAG: PEP-CTERM sorting domain-containing protein [Planctomycetes bacterium]|nr:PEP-CTERM sorting domain-containing protein [Planctomycetota bacterium]
MGRYQSAAAALGIALCLATSSKGVLIKSFAGASGPGLGSFMLVDSDIINGFEGNDDLEDNGLSSNFFRYDLVFTSNQFIDITINAASAPGDASVSEYDLIFPTAKNQTMTTWTGLHMVLGFMDGSTFRPGGASGLDFDDPDPNTFVDGDFFIPVRNIDDLVVTGPDLFNDNFVNLLYSIDVPGLNDVPDYAPRTTDGYQFVLRVEPIALLTRDPGPTTPEPTTLVLLASGLMMLHRRR